MLVTGADDAMPKVCPWASLMDGQMTKDNKSPDSVRNTGFISFPQTSSPKHSHNPHPGLPVTPDREGSHEAVVSKHVPSGRMGRLPRRVAGDPGEGQGPGY